MRIAASAAILGLSWFGAVNAGTSLLVWMLSSLVSDDAAASVWRSRLLLMLRFLPVAASTTVCLGLFVPAHLLLEPARGDEPLGVLLLAWAAASAVLLARSGWRILALVRGSRQLAVWIRRGLDVTSAGRAWVETPPLTGIALAGILRPTVLVGTAARTALTPPELDVAIAHEQAHRRSFDNLTRAAMTCAPDFFGLTGAARRIEGLWNAGAECLADARAAGGNAERATLLASALVKVARLRASDALRPAVFSLLHEPALVETRVRLLLGPCSRPPAATPSRATIAVALACTIAIAWAAGVPYALHQFTELLIARLP